MEREFDKWCMLAGCPEVMLVVNGNEDWPDYKYLSANSRLINFSCNSSKRIGVSRFWTISTMVL